MPSGWRVETVDALDNVDMGFGRASGLVALVIDPADRAHIAFGDKSRIIYAQETDSDWSFQTVIERKALGQHLDLTLDSEGIPHLIYYVLRRHHPPLGEVYYATPTRGR